MSCPESDGLITGAYTGSSMPAARTQEGHARALPTVDQMERVRSGPVSIWFGEPWPLNLRSEVLNPCLQLSSQWEVITLDISSFLSPPLSNLAFPALTTLTLFHMGSETTADVSRTDFLPALEQLVLNLGDHGLPQDLRSLIPWSQLRNCEVRELDSRDCLWIAARLPQDANLVVDNGYNGVKSLLGPSPTTSLIRSLTLTQCYRSFLIDILDVLSVPALDTFALHHDATEARVGLGAHVARFLDRSASTLTHLELTAHLEEHDLVHLLKSSHVRSVIDLKIANIWPTPPVLAALAEGPLLKLRRLTLGGAQDENVLLKALGTYNRPRISSSEEYLPMGELQHEDFAECRQHVTAKIGAPWSI
ncbi:hypothetical protein B0H16DRAFT_1464965 [Mycena metata]|uniref:Uncharacterized protein n=1 Tax=Mycena metata TaxID=1033252 RepID=A0AAD7IDU0_9AGAR|nr:hypothetical protein B0H16DRAFT_1464965 [Mycena metata]